MAAGGNNAPAAVVFHHRGMNDVADLQRRMTLPQLDTTDVPSERAIV
jgi:hypothetical protein